MLWTLTGLQLVSGNLLHHVKVLFQPLSPTAGTTQFIPGAAATVFIKNGKHTAEVTVCIAA